MHNPSINTYWLVITNATASAGNAGEHEMKQMSMYLITNM